MNRHLWAGLTTLALITTACGPAADTEGATGGAAIGSTDGMRNTVVPVYEAEAWPQALPNDWVIGLATGIASDSEDRIWLLHRPRTVSEEDRGRAAPAVLEFDVAGNLIQAWGGAEYRDSDEFEWPATEHGISVDDDGHVWIAGSGAGDHQILKFTRDGQFVMQIGKSGSSQGNLDTQNLDRPSDVDIRSETNEIFVSDGYGNRRIIVFDTNTGEFKRMWGAYGQPPQDPMPDEDEFDPEHFNLVHGIAVSHDGMVYVADSRSMRVQVFEQGGEFVAEKEMGRYPDPDPAVLAARASDMSFGAPTANLLRDTSMAHRSANGVALSRDPEQRWLYIAERSEHKVVILDRETLEEVASFGQHGDLVGEWYVLHGMALDSQGNLYTVEVNGLGGNRKRVQRFVLMP